MKTESLCPSFLSVQCPNCGMWRMVSESGTVQKCSCCGDDEHEDEDAMNDAHMDSVLEKASFKHDPQPEY